jgi:lipopolysaccharide transport system ATP-binding protein
MFNNKTSGTISLINIGKLYRINELRHRETLSEKISTFFKGRDRNTINPSCQKAITTQDYIWALKGISLHVNAGQVMGLIGKNGSGKSTLLKIISRITKPTEGSLQINGRVGALLEVGTGFHPDLSGKENIYLNASIIGMNKKEIESQLDSIIEFSEIGHFIDTPVKHYSSGMFMRLAFSVAAHLNSEIMLIDEVLAVGDAAFQNKCKDKIKAIAKSGKTIIFTSHDMSAIKDICDQCLVIDNGKIIYLGNSDEAIKIYNRLL